jgi:hypothetical protein
VRHDAFKPLDKWDRFGRFVRELAKRIRAMRLAARLLHSATRGKRKWNLRTTNKPHTTSSVGTESIVDLSSSFALNPRLLSG